MSRRLVHKATIQDEPNDHVDVLLNAPAPSVALAPGDLAHLVGGKHVRVLDCRGASEARAGRLKGSLTLNLKGAGAAATAEPALVEALHELLAVESVGAEVPLCLLGSGKSNAEDPASLVCRVLVSVCASLLHTHVHTHACTHVHTHTGARAYTHAHAAGNVAHRGGC